MKANIFFTAVLSTMLMACDNKPDYDASGFFEATTVTISAETTGRLLSVSVSEGDSVSSGREIAMVDTTLLVLQLKQSGSVRKATESVSPDISAQAASLRAEIAHQESERDRFGRLLADGATTQKQYDDIVARLGVLRGQLSALLSTLDKNKLSISDNSVSLQYQTDQIEEWISRCKITSPLSGTVLEKYAEPGEFVVPGRPLCKIADLDSIYLRAYFTASRLASLKIGQKVTVVADFGGDERYEYPGTVRWISQESEFTPKSVQTPDSRANLVYAVKIAVKNDGRLKLGQYGEVRL